MIKYILISSKLLLTFLGLLFIGNSLNAQSNPCTLSITQNSCCCNHIELVASTPSSSNITSVYTWYIDQNPASNSAAIIVCKGANFGYSFPIAGNHIIYVKAICTQVDNNGNVTSVNTTYANQSVEIADVSAVNFTTTVINNSNQTSSCQVQQFTQAVSFAAQGLPANTLVAWNFGDGQTDNGTTVCHQFQPNKVYQVCMICNVFITDIINNIPVSHLACTKQICQTICTGNCCDGCLIPIN
jgi:hypothetical protein